MRKRTMASPLDLVDSYLHCCCAFVNIRPRDRCLGNYSHHCMPRTEENQDESSKPTAKKDLIVNYGTNEDGCV